MMPPFSRGGSFCGLSVYALLLFACVNQPPEITSVGPYSIENSILDAFLADSVISPYFDVVAGETLTFEVSATDPEEDPIRFSAGPLPRGAEFDPEQAAFTWTPSTEDLGNDGFMQFYLYVVAQDSEGGWDSVVIEIVASMPDEYSSWESDR